MNDKGIALKRDGIASDHQPRLAAASPRDEAVPGSSEPPESIPPQALLARVLQRENLQRALKQVRRNQGAPGSQLRCYLWKQWGRAGYRELRKRRVNVREAWSTSKSAHGPWRLSNTPALRLALPRRYFKNLGLPAIAVR